MPFILNMHDCYIEAETHFLLKRARLVLALVMILALLISCSRGEQETAPEVIGSDAALSESAQSLETLQTLSAPAGLNTRRLFAQPAPSEEARFDRLEGEVQRLRDDFDLVSPAITRLVAVEQDMRDLMDQLEVLLNDDSPDLINVSPLDTSDNQITPLQPAPGAPVLQPTANPQPPVLEPVGDAPVLEPVPVLTKTPVATSANTAAAANLPNVENLRIGEHVDKTRIVLDMNSKVDYSTSVADNGKTVNLTLRNASWQTDTSWSSAKSPVIKSWNAQQVGNDVNISFQLAYPGRVKYDAFVAPRNGYERLVVDIFSDEMHLAK